MHRTARRPKIVVSADGTGLVFQAGGVLLTQALRAASLDRGLTVALERWRAPRAVHDPGKIKGSWMRCGLRWGRCRRRSRSCAPGWARTRGTLPGRRRRRGWPKPAPRSLREKDRSQAGAAAGVAGGRWNRPVTRTRWSGTSRASARAAGRPVARPGGRDGTASGRGPARSHRGAGHRAPDPVRRCGCGMITAGKAPAGVSAPGADRGPGGALR
jgi:hypothetical protein